MRKSLCCNAPAVIHGARRRLCTKCEKTWTIRPKKRGRKSKRVRTSLGSSILKNASSLRGLSATRGISREVLRKKFHRSIKNKFVVKSLTKSLPVGPLIAIIDGLWVSQDKHKRVTHTCFIVLLRSVYEDKARVAIVKLKIFDQIPPSVKKRIVALISDGCICQWLSLFHRVAILLTNSHLV